MRVKFSLSPNSKLGQVHAIQNSKFEKGKRERPNLQSTFFYMGMLIDTHANRPVTHYCAV